MAEATKHVQQINGGNLVSDLRSLFSLVRTKRTIAFAYGFMFAFVVFTVFLAFNPSSNSSSPWFTSVFSSTSTSSSSPSSSSSSSIFSDESYRSHFSSIFSYFFPNSSQPLHDSSSSGPSQPPNTTRSENSTSQSPIKVPVILKNQTTTKNQTQDEELGTKIGDLKPNQTTIAPPNPEKNQTKIPILESPSKGLDLNGTGNGGDKGVAESNSTSTSTGEATKKKKKEGIEEEMVESLEKCDMFDGEWVMDDSYPLYKPGSCSLIDEQFNCFLNGRPDSNFQKLKWKPKGCTLPRLNGSHMLEMLRGKRLVYVGDSLNRNMWESLVCILKNSVKDQSKVYEAHGHDHFRAEAHYSFIFKDYDCTIEFFVAPFLVQEWEMKDRNGTKKETLRIDLIASSAEHYKTADIIVFNTGHWWTHDKTAKGQDYYQEGSHVYNDLDVLEAFRRALTTWGRWVDANVNPSKSLVFFRGYSASHFSGGQWNSGGQCDNETEPIKNTTYLTPYPPKMRVLESVLKGMKTRVSYLNITRLTDYRKDGHPSIYRKLKVPEVERRSPLKFQDCSHWCLPGVPDSWNELLYAELLVKQKLRLQQQHQQKKS